jgi:hypothetical protein
VENIEAMLFHQVSRIPSVIQRLFTKMYMFILSFRAHANIYSEFFKNLPGSFSPKSNYQVAILFTTIQSESTKNVSFERIKYTSTG